MWRTLQNVFFSGMLYFSSQRDAHQRKRHLPSRSSCSLSINKQPPLLSKTSLDSTKYGSIKWKQENGWNSEKFGTIATWAGVRLVLNPPEVCQPVVHCQVNSRSAPVAPVKGSVPPCLFCQCFCLGTWLFKSGVNWFTLDGGSYLQLELQDTYSLLWS